MKKQPDGQKQGHGWEIGGALVAIVLISLPALPDIYYGTARTEAEAGQFGDFIGGYFGTVFLVISVAVLVGSYRNQRFSDRLTAFEARFFELLRYHRENTVEVEVDEVKGRRAFVSFIREWRLLLDLVKAAESAVSVPLTVRERSALSYLAFYHGSGPNGRRTLAEAARRRGCAAPLVQELIRRMSVDWTLYRKVAQGEATQGEIALGLSAGPVTPDKLKPLAYVPFEGHHSRLAHYFRHLFHLVKYAGKRAPGDTAQEYVDLVRAQLTTHEQALLALHADAVEGAWRSQDHLQRFHLIKNIPQGFLKEDEFDVRTIFPKVQYADAANDQS